MQFRDDADANVGQQTQQGRSSPVEARSGPALVRELLKYAAATPSTNPGNREVGLRWDEVGDRQIRYVMDAGLAPLLYRATQDTIEQSPAAWRDALKAADLTARVIYGNVCDATSEIIDACRERGVRVTLLKGISISDQHYPAAHLRPMGDIDLLVAENDREWVESMMLRRDYSRMSDFRPGEGAPHGAPLFHRERRVWVEIHTALFPKGERLMRKGLFSPSQIDSQTVASTFQGRPVYRLTGELQLVYIASYWIRDLTRNAFHPSFVTPLLDAVYLLKASGQALDWDGLLEWLDNDIATASLYVMLLYLSAHGLDHSATRILSRLASSQDIVRAPELRIICAMIDTNLVGGRPFLGQFGERHPMVARTVLNSILASGSHVGKLLSFPWNVVFPPWIPERYSIRYQRQRFRRLLRGRA
jgi:hypothetical protein